MPRPCAFAAARRAVAALGVLPLILALPSSARADTQLWVMASMTRSLSDQWRVNVEVAPRWERDVSDYSRTVMRAQLARVQTSPRIMKVAVP